MGKKCIFWLVAIFVFLTSPALATHIVGGEFALEHQSGNSYYLKLFLYNDDINGNPGAIDSYANVHIWRKRDNSRVGTYSLSLIEKTPISYNTPDCPERPVRTSKVTYRTEIFLDEALFSDPEGYYVSYERCCRNNIIDNIQRPEATGQTFYMEFPGVSSNGTAFINSSPVLPPPPNDYVPVNQLFRFNVKAADADGDSLVYRLVDPLAGYSSPDFPVPSNPMPRPYPRVAWQLGYNVQNMIQGNPALRITSDGFLEVSPSKEGLFVIALSVEEYRNKQKIGEVRREYQVVVYTPNISDPRVNSSLNNYQNTDEISVEFFLGEPVNFQVLVKDDEQNDLGIRVVGEDFNLAQLGMSFPAATGKGQAQASFSWFPPCDLPLTDGKAEYTLYFIGEDFDFCNTSKNDTLKVNLTFLPAPNRPPVLSAGLAGETVSDTLVLRYGQQTGPLVIDIAGFDQDLKDMISLTLDSTTAPQALFEWSDVSGNGTVRTALRLPSICEILNGQPEAFYTFKFVTRDNGCNPAADTLRLHVLVQDSPQNFSDVNYVNVFTPNGDRCNALFELRNLPEDGCSNRFEFVRVYNRWGKLLFESHDRNFKWHAENQPSGIYYYLLRYTNFSYKSTLSLMLGEPVYSADCPSP